MATSQQSIFSASTQFHSGILLVFFVVLLTPPILHAQTFSVLYAFTGGTDGGAPLSDLVRDASGNLYGTTDIGGDLSCRPPDGCGTVFKLDPSGNETVLYAFHGQAEGDAPDGLVLGPAGSLYGTTQEGGDPGCDLGCGTVFRLDARGYHLVYSFHGQDGAYPGGHLAVDSAGNLYGYTLNGGVQCQPRNSQSCGVIFRVDRSGRETVVHTFMGGVKDGAFPSGGLMFSKSGLLLGTTAQGGGTECGGNGCGTVFAFDSRGKQTVLYAFRGGDDGSYPDGYGSLDASGNIYGTTLFGGTTPCQGSGCGTVFELSPNPGGGWTKTTLYNFTGNTDSAYPEGVIRSSTGEIYGTTSEGYDACPPNPDCGTVFTIDASHNFTTLYSFTGGADGLAPASRLLRDSAGNLYGTTLSGGKPGCFNGGCGTIFKLAP